MKRKTAPKTSPKDRPAKPAGVPQSAAPVNPGARGNGQSSDHAPRIAASPAPLRWPDPPPTDDIQLPNEMDLTEEEFYHIIARRARQGQPAPADDQAPFDFDQMRRRVLEKQLDESGITAPALDGRAVVKLLQEAGDRLFENTELLDIVLLEAVRHEVKASPLHGDREAAFKALIDSLRGIMQDIYQAANEAKAGRVARIDHGHIDLDNPLWEAPSGPAPVSPAESLETTFRPVAIERLVTRHDDGSTVVIYRAATRPGHVAAGFISAARDSVPEMTISMLDGAAVVGMPGFNPEAMQPEQAYYFGECLRRTAAEAAQRKATPATEADSAAPVDQVEDGPPAPGAETGNKGLQEVIGRPAAHRAAPITTQAHPRPLAG